MGITMLGPCGGYGGGAQGMNAEGVKRITKLLIRHGHAIDAFGFAYQRHNGSQDQTALWGGSSGGLSQIHLDEDEYITGVSGHFGRFDSCNIIRSLKFETNKRYGPSGIGPYGCEEGSPFFLKAPGGKIVGFHARSGKYFDAIGIYVET